MQLHAYLHFRKVIKILAVRWLGTKLVQIQSSKKTTASSGVARSLVLAGHLLYASPLAQHLRTLRVRLRDMSGTNMVLWPVTYPARPGLRTSLTASDES